MVWKEKQFGFGLIAFKKYPELIPLVVIVAAPCILAVAAIGYFLIQKPDVRINKLAESPPWERVEPNKPSKLLTFRQKYDMPPELEKLRKEIGSYKY